MDFLLRIAPFALRVGDGPCEPRVALIPIAREGDGNTSVN